MSALKNNVSNYESLDYKLAKSIWNIFGTLIGLKKNILFSSLQSISLYIFCVVEKKVHIYLDKVNEVDFIFSCFIITARGKGKKKKLTDDWTEMVSCMFVKVSYRIWFKCF